MCTKVYNFSFPIPVVQNIPTAPRAGGHILPTPVPNRHLRTASASGDEDTSSSDRHGSSQKQGQEDYSGPFQGRARALVDYTPSPYDRDALKFKVQHHRKISLYLEN